MRGESLTATATTAARSNPFALVFGGGLVILLGFVTIVGHKWPLMVTPLQLDIIAVPLTWLFGETLGAYISGALCFFVGGFFVWAGLNDRASGN